VGLPRSAAALNPGSAIGCVSLAVSSLSRLFLGLTRKSEVMTGVALFFRRRRLLAPCTPSDILGNFLSSSELYCTKETRQLHEGNQALAPNRCNPLLRYIKALDDMSAVRPLPLPHLEFRNLPGSRTQILNYNVLFESDT